MDDATVLNRINELVDEEHRLRSGVQDGTVTTDEEHARLRTVEEALDQCWDLLRRRRAARDAGGDPDSAQPQSVDQVERYLQ